MCRLRPCIRHKKEPKQERNHLYHVFRVWNVMMGINGISIPRPVGRTRWPHILTLSSSPSSNPYPLPRALAHCELVCTPCRFRVPRRTCLPSIFLLLTCPPPFPIATPLIVGRADPNNHSSFFSSLLPITCLDTLGSSWPSTKGYLIVKHQMSK